MTQRHKTPRKPRTPKSSLGEQVFISLIRTTDAVTRKAEALLKPVALSGTQYNILRILRGAGASGLACREIGDRLISRDPDLTRLLDRLDSRGLIARSRELDDRRVVKTRITLEGLQILRDLDEPVQSLHRKQLLRLSQKQLRQLLLLLGLARGEGKPPEMLQRFS
jgi:DNA-binding MarR family transcriptional regulator